MENILSYESGIIGTPCSRGYTQYMTVALAGHGDEKRIMEIIEEARSFQLSYGNRQWADGYPSRSLIEEDIRTGIGYSIIVNSEIAGYMAIVTHDVSYDRIDGAWIADWPYIAIHRLALSDRYRGQGLFPSIISKAIDIGREKGALSLRIDTDRSNPIMKHLLEKLGFVHTGYVLFEGDPKPAYELPFRTFPRE